MSGDIHPETQVYGIDRGAATQFCSANSTHGYLVYLLVYLLIVYLLVYLLLVYPYLEMSHHTVLMVGVSEGLAA